jgi:hypothetical protein
LWHSNVKNISIKNVEAKQQNHKGISVIKNRTLKVYQNIRLFNYIAPATLRIIKDNYSLHDETIRKTPLLDEMFNDFDYLYKRLRTKQENDDIKGKKQKVFDIVQV